jgi:hypothetical protein
VRWASRGRISRESGNVKDQGSARRTGGWAGACVREVWADRVDELVTLPFPSVALDKDARSRNSGVRYFGAEPQARHLQAVPSGKLGYLATARTRSKSTPLGCDIQKAVAPTHIDSAWPAGLASFISKQGARGTAPPSPVTAQIARWRASFFHPGQMTGQRSTSRRDREPHRSSPADDCASPAP